MKNGKIIHQLTSFHTSIPEPANTITIPIELVNQPLQNTVDTGGRYGLLTLENKFGASGYYNDKKDRNTYKTPWYRDFL